MIKFYSTDGIEYEYFFVKGCIYTVCRVWQLTNIDINTRKEKNDFVSRVMFGRSKSTIIFLFSKKAECYEMLEKSEWRVDDKGYCFYR